MSEKEEMDHNPERNFDDQVEDLHRILTGDRPSWRAFLDATEAACKINDQLAAAPEDEEAVRANQATIDQALGWMSLRYFQEYRKRGGLADQQQFERYLGSFVATYTQAMSEDEDSRELRWLQWVLDELGGDGAEGTRIFATIDTFHHA